MLALYVSANFFIIFQYAHTAKQTITQIDEVAHSALRNSTTWAEFSLSGYMQRYLDR